VRLPWYDPGNPESATPKKQATPKQIESLKKGREKQEFERAYRKWFEYSGRHLVSANEAIQWSINVLEQAEKWVILDTETTGLYNAEIVQIGIIDLSGKIILDSLVKPTIPIPIEVSMIHGITDDMVENSPSFSLIYPKIKEALENKFVCIYNAEFDISILKYCCLLHNLPLLGLKNKSTCLMEIYSQFYGEWSNYYDDYKWQPLGGNHGVIGDCQAALQLIKDMASSEIFDTSKKGFREKFFQDNS
jgi:DNA polymerase-3 subunit epsilon